MTDLTARLKSWRSVHLAKLHSLMDEAADEMERLSKTGHCPAPESGTNPDNVWNKLAQEIACMRSDISRRANLESGLRAGVVRLQEAAKLTTEEREAIEWAVAVASDCEHPAEDTLRALLDRRRDTPATRATPRVGSEQSGCTLTDAEREAVEWYSGLTGATRPAGARSTLRNLLDRMA